MRITDAIPVLERDLKGMLRANARTPAGARVPADIVLLRKIELALREGGFRDLEIAQLVPDGGGLNGMDRRVFNRRRRPR